MRVSGKTKGEMIFNVKRIAVLGLILFVGAASLGAGGKKQPETAALRVSWWGGDARHEAMLKMIELFKAKYPAVQVEPEYSAFAQYRDKFTIQLTSGSAPDVMAVDQPWVSSIVKQGDFFLTLSDYPSLIDLKGFDGFLMDAYCVVGGKTKFVPGGVNGMGSLVDAKALAPFGFDVNAKTFTWDELIALGEKVQAANPNQYLACTDSKQAALYYVRVYLRQLTGRQLINDDGSMGCTREELARALTLAETLYSKRIFQPIEQSAAYNNTMTQNPAWLDRNMFMILGRTSVMTDASARLYKDGVPTTTNFIMPGLPESKESGVEVRPTVLFAANKGAFSPEAAVQFLNFMFCTEEAAAVLKSNFSIPARENIRRWASGQQGILEPAALANVQYSLVNAGSVLNAWSSNAEVENMFTEIMEKIAYKQYKTMLEAADDVIGRIKAIVSNG
jgi:oligogalacturonide transport system substrate-binding protein